MTDLLADNPYQSPTDSSAPNAPPPSKALATWAIWLSVIFGISPVGGDILFSASRAENPFVYPALTLLFLTMMVAPLVLLYCRGGDAPLLLRQFA